MSEWQDMDTAPKDGTVIALEMEETGEVLAGAFGFDEFVGKECWIVFTPELACKAAGLDPTVDRRPVKWQPLPMPTAWMRLYK